MVAQKVRKKYATFLKVLISAGLLAWLVRSIEWQHVADLLAGAKIPWLAAALGWIVVSVAVSAYKWQLLVFCKMKFPIFATSFSPGGWGFLGHCDLIRIHVMHQNRLACFIR